MCKKFPYPNALIVKVTSQASLRNEDVRDLKDDKKKKKKEENYEIPEFQMVHFGNREMLALNKS